jgi:hypothetical protein
LTEALAWVRKQGLSPARVLQTLALDGDQDGLRRPAFG